MPWCKVVRTSVANKNTTELNLLLIKLQGIETATEIPAGMEFIPSSVPDGEYQMNVPSTGAAAELAILVNPVCMTFEDYYAGFSADSHPAFSVKVRLPFA